MTHLPAVEVVVVGAGVIGAASAYELARKGIRTAIVEAGEVGSVASGASAGGVRQQNRDPRELPIAIKAIGRWPQLEEELDTDLHYLQDGHVQLVEFENDLPAVEARVAREQAAGLDIEMVYGDDLRELVQGVAPHIVAGSYCRTDGHAMPPWVAKAYVRAAVRLGATLYQFTRVTDIHVEHNRVRSVETTRGTIECDWVINAAGAWGRQLAGMVDVDLPVEIRALQMLLTEQMPPRLKQVLGCVSKQVSLKQIPTGSYLIGGGWDGTVYQDRRFGRVRGGSICGSAAHSSAIYPILRQTRLVRAWSGLEAISRDGAPILGPVPQLDGFLIACGFSGHGFALSPQIGVIMSELVSTGEPSVPIDALSIDRFL
jgi:sarcosine oxidase, subunit beta